VRSRDGDGGRTARGPRRVRAQGSQVWPRRAAAGAGWPPPCPGPGVPPRARFGDGWRVRALPGGTSSHARSGVETSFDLGGPKSHLRGADQLQQRMREVDKLTCRTRRRRATGRASRLRPRTGTDDLPCVLQGIREVADIASAGGPACCALSVVRPQQLRDALPR